VTVRACILGCSGPALSDAERGFFREANPWGFILFARNVESPDQVRRLVDDLRASVDRADAPALIDQEGGRVQRLKPPLWPAYPPGRAYGELPPVERRDLAWLGARLIAADLKALGVTVDCLPVLDAPLPGASNVIGDRAYANDPEEIARLGRAAADGLMAGGVLPVMKHAPGHGRARVDSHKKLPVVDASLADLAARDFAPFRALADLPMAMTAHVVYRALDRARPATTSPVVIAETIRGAIGFDGLLISDDLSMNALKGSLGERAAAALAAGCDVALHCNGDATEMTAVASASPPLAGKPLARAAAALARLPRAPEPFDATQGRARFDAAFGGRWAA
jgi:beta-N-acetylhexosaminidase